MRVSVFLVLPSQEPLQASAQAGINRNPPTSLSNVRSPARVLLDPNFHAVPLGSGRVDIGASLATHAPKTSKTFAVRGYIEVESMNALPTEAEGHLLFADPQIAPFITCGGTAPVGTDATVATKLNVAALSGKNLDGAGVAVAIMDTGINLNHLTTKLGVTPNLDAANSWMAPGNTNAPGAHPVDHGTMCAFDALIAAPKATLLDFPILANTAPGGSIAGQTLSVALLGFAQLLAFWGVAFAPAGAPKFKALVSSNSWGIFHPSWDFPAGHPGRFIDNPNHPFNIIVSTLARTGADVIFAGGNCGAECADGRCQGRTTEAIMGANTLPEVLTIAGCDTSDQRVGYSSQGPSITGMFQQKPDVTCYTHFRGSEAFGAGSPDLGTSAACPVAAGCVAALRTRASPTLTTPARLITAIQITARRVPRQTGWNQDYGFGILDPVAVAASLGI